MAKVLAPNVGHYKKSFIWIGPKRLSTKARDTKEFELQGDLNYRVALLEVWMLVFFPTEAVSLLSSKVSNLFSKYGSDSECICFGKRNVARKVLKLFVRGLSSIV